VRLQDKDGFKDGGKVFDDLKQAVKFADEKVDFKNVSWS
jgi:hypothetical protein